MKPLKPLDYAELAVQRSPESYSVVAFRGGRVDAPTFDEAVAEARGRLKPTVGRPAMIYAIRGTSHSHLMNFDLRGEPMTVYLLTYAGGPRGNQPPAYTTLDIVRYASAAAATDAAERLAKEKSPLGAKVVADEKSLADCEGPFLIRVFNALNPEKPVTRFATKADAVRRVWAMIVAIAGGKPVIGVGAHPDAEEPKPEQPAAPSPLAPAGDVADVVAAHDKEREVKAEKKARATRGTMTFPSGKVADIRPVRAGTGRAEVLKRLTGKFTAEQIAKDVKVNGKSITVSQLGGFVRFLSTIGIGTEQDANGKLKAVYPGSKTVDDVIASAAAE